MLKIRASTLYATAILLFLAFVIVIPNFFTDATRASWPSWLPNRQLNLGLDLQGGSHLLLRVDVASVENEYRQELRNSISDVLNLNDPNARLVTDNNKTVITLAAEADTATILGQLRERVPADWQQQGNTLTMTLTPQAIAAVREQAMSKSLDIIRLRVDETGTKEPTIQRQGKQDILLQLPGVDDPARIRQLLGKTAKLTFHLVNEDIGMVLGNAQKVPGSSKLLPYSDNNVAEAVSEKPYLAVYRRAMLSGDMLVDAQASFQDTQPVVSFRFNTLGAKKFGLATSQNVGKRFAIVLDDEVISAPVIREAIAGGSGIISGSFTTQSAKDLALLLRSGALPAPLTIEEERTVGPGLGADSIAFGKTASLIGIVFVIILTLAIYGRFGVYAVIALLANLLLLVAALTLLQATLTLPGIAGIVLTIGMAVDANVLIFERMRDESMQQGNLLQILDSGYKKAIATILDSNITTLIAALLLFIFGSGSVKGFGVTLALGILTTLFTAIVISKMLIALWYRRSRPTALPII